MSAQLCVQVDVQRALFYVGQSAASILFPSLRPFDEVLSALANQDLATPSWNEEEGKCGQFALGYQELNALRAPKVTAARQKGYRLISYVHPEAGLPLDCRFDDNYFVLNHALIHPLVTLGHNVFVWSGAMIGHHNIIGDHCWITSCANIAGVVTVGRNCFFAVNATVGHGITIGDECFWGANTLITKCVEDREVFLTKSTDPFRLDSSQFLRLSNFEEL